MPFESDNAWPTGLVMIFDHARARYATFESHYYGPYDKLLNYCFGTSFQFYDKNDKSVLIVDVKDDSWAQKAELRYRADKQMRDWYALMLDECPIPRLWGLSLLGTFMGVYCGDTASYDVDPPAIPRPEPVTRVLYPNLAGEWDLDIF
ncbi:hypothetical protein BD414DRAFT_322776 [Trametes punicea]|nr:hypothetical protein BD414DRAFT_322776 [Trametes punicea]